MDWITIYARLAADRNDPLAWPAIAARVRAWAGAYLRTEAWHTIEDVVADTCSCVAVSFERARGGETFAGFVYGCYLNERRRTLARVRGPTAATLDLDDPRLVVHADRLLPVEDQATVWHALADLSIDGSTRPPETRRNQSKKESRPR